MDVCNKQGKVFLQREDYEEKERNVLFCQYSFLPVLQCLENKLFEMACIEFTNISNSIRPMAP